MSHSISQKFHTKSLLTFSLPSIIMMMFCAVQSMSGSIFASKFINQNAMAATTVIYPLLAIFIAISVMFATGSNAIIAKNLGEGKIEKARQNFTVTVITGVCVGVVLMIIMILFEDTIIYRLGATDEVAAYCKVYFNSYVYSLPFVFLEIFTQYFFVTEGKPLIGMILIILGGISNIVCNIILVVILKLGIMGTGISLASSFVLPGIAFLVYFGFKHNTTLHFVKPKLHKGYILNSCTNGSSEMVTNLALAVITTVLNLIMGRIAGSDGLAAVGVIVQMQFLLNSMYIGFGAGVAPIYAFAYGSNNREQTKNVFKISIRFVIISCIVIAALCQLFTPFIVSLFINPSSSAYTLGKTGFRIFGMGYLFAGFNIFSSIFFTAHSNGKTSSLISFLRTFVFIIGMLLILPNFLEITGVWLAIPCAEFLASIVSFTLLKKYRSIYHY